MANSKAKGRSSQSTARSITLDQILSIRSLVSGETPCWSPDGSSIAFVSSLGGAPDIWTVSPEGGFPTRLTLGMGEVEFLASRMPRWSPDGRFISYVSNKSGTDEIWLWPKSGAAQYKLTTLGGRVHSMDWSQDSQSLAVSCNRFGAYDIYRVDVPTGDAIRLTSDSLYEVNPVFTPDGRHVLYVRLNESWEDHEIIMITTDGNEARTVLKDTDFFDYSSGKAFGYPLVSPDGKTALYRTQRSGYINYWKVALSSGHTEPLSPDDTEQSDACWSPDGSRVAYVSNRNGTLDLRVIDVECGKSTSLFSPEMGVCSAPEWSPDGQVISFLYGTPTAPEDVWVVSLEDGEARQLTFSLPGGNLRRNLIVPEKVEYQSFDGLTIHAYLYAPRDKSTPGGYPGILFIHGGPTSQFLDDFQPYVQYLVQRGYAVLLPNIRGSSGYGQEFERLNDKDWGHGDLKDAIAGTEFLKGLEYVNPKKMGITGTSYGGNLSMCAIAFTRDIFQAAVPMSGYGDRPKLRTELELRHIKQLEHEFGTFEEHEEIWYRCSPIYGVKNATTPAFVLHGEGREPGSEASKDFAEALKLHYKTVEYKSYPDECYYVRSHDGVRQMLIDVSDFFDRYLKDNLGATSR